MSSRGSIGFLVHPGVDQPLDAVRAHVHDNGFDTWVAIDDAEKTVSAHASDTKLLITIGGDGTFLFGARMCSRQNIPVLGVNRGRFGFLTEDDADALPMRIDDFIAGRYRLEQRSLLAAAISAPGKEVHHCEAINDVAIKSDGIFTVRIRVDVDDEFFGEFDADGVVLSTATGSTAYSLSAGGPPIDPRVPALVIVPLAPHAITARAVVVPDTVTLRVGIARGDTIFAADGSDPLHCAAGTSMIVKKGGAFSVVRFASSASFLRRLREKSNFGIPLKGAGHSSQGSH